jgi:GT2 family glycosyltransferase
MIERRKFLAAGGFDEAFPVAFNDVDLSFRLLRQGLFNVVCQAARWLHHESMSRGRDWDDPEKYTRQVAEIQNLYLRHPEMLAHDPFYNPNLAQDSLRFEPAA